MRRFVPTRTGSRRFRHRLRATVRGPWIWQQDARMVRSGGTDALHGARLEGGRGDDLHGATDRQMMAPFDWSSETLAPAHTTIGRALPRLPAPHSLCSPWPTSLRCPAGNKVPRFVI